MQAEQALYIINTNRQPEGAVVIIERLDQYQFSPESDVPIEADHEVAMKTFTFGVVADDPPLKNWTYAVARGESAVRRLVMRFLLAEVFDHEDMATEFCQQMLDSVAKQAAKSNFDPTLN